MHDSFRSRASQSWAPFVTFLPTTKPDLPASGHVPVEPLVTLPWNAWSRSWNRWSRCRGMSGHVRLESVVTIPGNAHRRSWAVNCTAGTATHDICADGDVCTVTGGRSLCQ